MAKASEGTDLVIYDDTDGMVEMLRGNVAPEIEDPEAIAAQITERILNATNVDEILGGMTALHAQDVLDRPFILNAVRLAKSAYEDGPGVFSILDAEFADDGSKDAITCGGRNVMAQAVQLHRIGALPLAVQIRQSETQTANGYRVLRLEAA